jgi:uncharacterized protein YecA (UPF0149 family)
VQRPDEIAQLEAQAEAKHHQDFDGAIAQHPGEEGELDPSEILAQLQAIQASGGSVTPAARPQPAAPKIARNDLCPCGSGKKFKKCHGAVDGEPTDDSED